IGDFSQIRSHAYIRGNVITGTHCLIGHTTEIKNSILLNHAAAPHFNYLGDSILGNYTNLGAGAKCSNLRLDKKNIHIIVAGKVFNTNRQKLGLILGDYSQLGCNSVTNPGTIFGQKVLCYPCVTVSGYIPNHSLIKGQKFIIEET
ncbi:MAG: hypothetical protein EBZ47_03230, partial [Chlamydiae bacterium]|nr:hypothetical protein [Chlamydiota bacterium]